MSPRPKHIPENARQTSISLTEEDNAAINWIRAARRQRGDDRRTLNDILVDALWYFLEQSEGKTKDEIRAMVPRIPISQASQANITEMPKPQKTR